MKKSIIGMVLGFAIGFFCRYAGIPSPAPPVVPGALLVLAMTVGFLLADRIAKHRTHTSRDVHGGPTGKPPSDREAR
jgi:XapX domain-containing protein